MLLYLILVAVFISHLGFAYAYKEPGQHPIATLGDCNVIWDSPSKDSLGSMPAGNGDIGINLWVEENGDLLFYLSKTDAWSGNARLLKIGKVRLSLSPNPFKKGVPFSQELILKDGVIHIEAGKAEEKVSIDIWVPQLTFLKDDFAFYKEQQEKGKEVWFYTCLGPQGNFANRFIEQPLIKTRILHWINYRYGITGYLHWGLNHWRPFHIDPYTITTDMNYAGNTLPGGDMNIVYPREGRLLSSIRLEAMRDGICDYELLKMLEENKPRKAREIAAKIVFSFDHYDLNIINFRKIRKEILMELSMN
ncbi:MAG: DUF5703 domain-containing protein [Prolixibacteraceae bacterium]